MVLTYQTRLRANLDIYKYLEKSPSLVEGARLEIA